MAKFNLLCLLIFFTLTISGQNRDSGIRQKEIGPKIKAYLDKNYGQNLKTRFYEEKNGDLKTIEADFEFENRKYTLSFSDQGDFLKEEVDLKFDSLPDSVQVNINNYLSGKYPRFKIVNSQEVNPNTERSVYKIEVRHSGDYYEVYFDRNGNFTKYDELIFQPINTQF